MINKILIFLFLISTTIVANNLPQTKIPTKHNSDLTIQNIADIQPGLGVIMIEFGHRFHIAYYAAKAKNWELAKYELHELIEAIEVAEVTRPKYKTKLKDFEDNFIKPLQESIKAKDFDKFSKNYTKTVDGCNNCHKNTGHPYIKYQLPTSPPLTLKMILE